MIEDSTEEFLTASSREGSFGHPSPRRRSTGGLICPHYNRNVKGECSSHDKVSPTDCGAMARNQPPLRAASCSPRRTTDASPCLASHHRARIDVTMKPPRRQADRYCGSARRTASARACAQDRENPNGGLHLHSGHGHGVGPSGPPRRGPV
jgi:hypothetical protein